MRVLETSGRGCEIYHMRNEVRRKFGNRIAPGVPLLRRRGLEIRKMFNGERCCEGRCKLINSPPEDERLNQRSSDVRGGIHKNTLEVISNIQEPQLPRSNLLLLIPNNMHFNRLNVILAKRAPPLHKCLLHAPINSRNPLALFTTPLNLRYIRNRPPKPSKP